MVEIAEGGGGGHGKGKKRAKKNSTKVDMTPLVDLAFLLLTFFVLTSTFSKPKVMSLVYPAKPDKTKPIIDQQTPINNAITFLLSDNRIFYYEGAFHSKPENGFPATVLEETDFSAQGIRKLLTDKNRYVLEKKAGYDNQLRSKTIADTTHSRLVKSAKSDLQALTVLIKTDDIATCKNFIDLIDELKIADIGRFAPVDIMQSELDLVKAKTK